MSNAFVLLTWVSFMYPWNYVLYALRCIIPFSFCVLFGVWRSSSFLSSSPVFRVCFHITSCNEVMIHGTMGYAMDWIHLFMLPCLFFFS